MYSWEVDAYLQEVTTLTEVIKEINKKQPRASTTTVVKHTKLLALKGTTVSFCNASSFFQGFRTRNRVFCYKTPWKDFQNIMYPVHFESQACLQASPHQEQPLLLLEIQASERDRNTERLQERLYWDRREGGEKRGRTEWAIILLKQAWNLNTK